MTVFETKARMKRYTIYFFVYWCFDSLMLHISHFFWLSEFQVTNFECLEISMSFFHSNFVQDGSHAPHIILEYTHLDSTIVADLFLNQRLLTDTHFLRTQNADGSKRIQTFDRSNSNLCHYQVSTGVFVLLWFVVAFVFARPNVCQQNGTHTFLIKY